MKYVLMFIETERFARQLEEMGAEPVVTDGPYMEGKEVVSGFAEAEVADLDEVLKLARSWPACPIVEIRPVS